MWKIIRSKIHVKCVSKVNGGAFYLLLFYASLVPSITHSRAINSRHTVGCSSTHSESQMFPSKDQVKGRAGYTAQDWRYGRGKVSYKIQCSWSHNSGTTSQRKKWFVGLALKGEWGLTPGWICWAFFFNYVSYAVYYYEQRVICFKNNAIWDGGSTASPST